MTLIEKHYKPGSKTFKCLVRHSAQVAGLAETVARRIEGLCEVDRVFVSEAAWLHDIGIYLTDAPEIGCYGEAPYLQHGILGAEILNDEGLPRHALVCERHIGVGLSVQDIQNQQLPLPHYDMTPQTIEEQIVAYADLFFSKHRKQGQGPRSAEQVRKALAGFGPGKVEIFDTWHTKFGQAVAGGE